MVTERIPQPKPRPIVGNLLTVSPEAGVFGVVDIARELGPIFRMEFPGDEEVIFVSSQELMNELSDESRFDKKIHGALWQVRDFASDGLFTAKTREENWGVAHRILMPAFGPAALRHMFDAMLDISEQLLLKWERQGESRLIDVSDDTTRLTLDAIALCSFNYRFTARTYTADTHSRLCGQDLLHGQLVSPPVTEVVCSSSGRPAQPAETA